MQFLTGGTAHEPPLRLIRCNSEADGTVRMKEKVLLYFFAHSFCYGRFLWEEFKMVKQNRIRAITVSAIFGAVGFILMLLEFPLAFIIPSFIKMDFSELPALIATFTFGPVYGILVCLIKNLLHLLVTTSAGVGELSNFLMGAIFVGVAGFIYKYRKTRTGALIGAVTGALAMAIISIATNYFIVYPAFSVLYGLPMPAILGMYKALLPSADTLLKALIIFNLPFNFIKGMIDALICFIIYKKISPILKYGKKMEKLKNNS